MAPLVLIVEDDPDIRDILKDVLTSRGYRPVTAANGRDAIDAIHREGVRPAAILLDLMMPEMDGAAFLAAKGCDVLLAGVPTVIVTAQPDKAPHHLSPTVKAVLEKPVPLPVILEMLRDLCEGQPTARPILARGTGRTTAGPRRARTQNG